MVDNKKMNKKFRVLLVYPNIPGMLVVSVPIGIFTTILLDNEFEVDLFDATIHSPDKSFSALKRVEYLQARRFSYEKDLNIRFTKDLITSFKDKVKEFKPDLIAISVAEDALNQCLRLLDSIKEYNIPHIVGGIFPTTCPEKLLSYDEINTVCVGEGEDAILEVCNRLRNNQSIEDIPNVWIKKKNGDIIKNEILPPVDLNKEVIPNYDLFDERRLYRPMGGRILKTLPLETYRGCPYACTFCCSPIWSEFYKKHGYTFTRKKTVDNIIKEVDQQVKKYSPELFYIIDDTFLARPVKEIREFTDKYKKYSIPFWMNTRPETIVKEKMQLIKDANCYRMSIGLECGNEKFRKEKLNRHISNDEFIKRMKVLDGFDIPYSINEMIGFPDETRELIFDTIELTRKLKNYDGLTVSVFTPYNGCRLRRECIEKGYLDKNQLTGHITESSMLDMPNLTKEEINGLIRTFVMYVKFPKDWWEYIQTAETDDETFRKLNNIYKNNIFTATQEEKSKIDFNELKERFLGL